jgi:hypothetical protein
MPSTKVVEPEAPADAGANGRIRGLLSLQDIIAADDIQTEYVEVPEWGGTVRVRGLTGEERNRVFGAIRVYGKQIKDEDEANTQFYARVIAASLIDDNGKLIAGQNAVPALLKKSGAALNRVWQVCRRLSGFTDEEVEAAKESLKTTPSDASGGD